MKTRLNVSLATATFALFFLAGCVSSRKYKGSQAELARVRNDSSRLAQQVSSLNGNVQDLQNKNTTLQRSLDSTSSNYAAQQHNLDYYQHYFKDQQNTMSQVSEDIKGALTQAGVTNGDVQMMDNAVYVSLDEDEIFHRNSTAITTNGKKVLDNLAGVIKSRDNMNVFVSRGDSTGGMNNGMASDNNNSGNMSGNNMSSNDNNTAMSSEQPEHHRPVHHRTHHVVAANNAGASNSTTSSTPSTASTQGTGSKTGTTTHHKIHHHYSSESGMAYNNTYGHMHNRAWALNQARMVSVADHFLQNGVPKINVSMQKPENGGSMNKNIRVIITPKMHDFNPPANSSATSSTR